MEICYLIIWNKPPSGDRYEKEDPEVVDMKPHKEHRTLSKAILLF
jgi:hypothetical protein